MLHPRFIQKILSLLLQTSLAALALAQSVSSAGDSLTSPPPPPPPTSLLPTSPPPWTDIALPREEIDAAQNAPRPLVGDIPPRAACRRHPFLPPHGPTLPPASCPYGYKPRPHCRPCMARRRPRPFGRHHPA
ncbi:hypothetical protein Ga0100231_019305 [Opitutaceae bacterium TAV4]|nr:hypothetical protein Ga0100231_019305 [Opitutaceae bacterium TAV4]